MKVYRCDVRVYATVYVKAHNKKQAAARIKEVDGSCLEVEGGGDIPISAAKFDDPALPAISLSPAMTVSLEEDFSESLVEDVGDD